MTKYIIMLTKNNIILIIELYENVEVNVVDDSLFKLIMEI